MLKTETWLPVVGWEGIYEVSDHGNVRRVLQGRGTRGPNFVLSPGAEKGGYLHVTLYKDRKATIRKVHVLVMESFVGRRKRGLEINHKDGNPSNNRLNNLEYCTPSENKLHSYSALNRVRKGAVGASNAKAKLDDEKVREIRRRYEEGGTSQQALADEYGINQTMVGFIIRRVAWSHVS